MASLDQQFQAFSKFGDSKSTGAAITLSQIDKWFKQAGVFDKKLTTTDTAIEFNKFKSKTMTLKDFNTFLDNLAKAKNMPIDDIKNKLKDCGAPGLAKGTAQADKSGVVDRLTDTNKYTGTHKERFDESGKGKGIEGREDVADNSGYVQNYKGQGTYDKTKK